MYLRFYIYLLALRLKKQWTLHTTPSYCRCIQIFLHFPRTVYWHITVSITHKYLFLSFPVCWHVQLCLQPACGEHSKGRSCLYLQSKPLLWVGQNTQATPLSELCQSTSPTHAPELSSTIGWLLNTKSIPPIHFILQKLTWKSWIMSWTAIESRRLICSNLGWALLYPQPTAFQLFSLNSLNTALPRSPVAPVIKTRLLGMSTSS